MPATSQPEPLLHVDDLTVRLSVGRTRRQSAARDITIVDQVSFDIAAGTTLGLVGESGCGKTTLGRAILRLIPSAFGRIRFDGVDWLAAPRSTLRKLRRDMQMVFQDPTGSLNPRMSVGDSIAEPLMTHGIDRLDRDRRVAELLEQVGLRSRDAHRYPHEFSGGQRQRIAIARAIALGPKLVICDEPVSSLDVSIQGQVLRLLLDLKHRLGLTYLFIAHDLAVVRHVSDRVAVMFAGRIVEMADVDDLFSTPRHPYTMSLLAAATGVSSTSHHPLVEGDALSSASCDDSAGVIAGTGCAYLSRCAFATQACAHAAPPLAHHAGKATGHVVACHLVEMLPAHGAASA